jgi:aspartyl-tRNA(Asn)/glutamyl-tRNA(Gln) amidotransferase subunit B
LLGKKEHAFWEAQIACDAYLGLHLVDEVLAANPKSVEEFRAGKEKAFNALVGQAMKASRGKANPAQVNEVLKRKLAG